AAARDVSDAGFDRTLRFPANRTAMETRGGSLWRNAQGIAHLRRLLSPARGATAADLRCNGDDRTRPLLAGTAQTDDCRNAALRPCAGGIYTFRHLLA